MTDTPGALPPAGWYPDPYGAPMERWWDGTQWTDHTNIPAAPEPTPYVAPVAEPVVEPIVESVPEPVQATPEPVQDDPFAGLFGQRTTPTETPAVAAEPAQQYTAPAEPVQQYTAPAEPIQQYTAPAEPVQQYTAPAEPVAPEPAKPASDSWSLAAEAPVEPVPLEPQRPEQSWFDAPSFEQMSFTQPGYSTADFSREQQAAPVDETPAYETPAYQPVSAQSAPVAVPLASAAGNATFDFGQLIAGPTGTGAEGSYWSNEDYDEDPTNSAATAGVAFGILAFIIPGIGALLGLVFSVLGLLRANRYASEGLGPIGRTKSLVGIGLSVVGGIVSGALLVWGLGLLAQNGNGAGDGGTTQTSGLTSYEQPELTANGTIPVAVGDTATIAFSSTGEPALQFTVTGTTTLAECTSDDGSVLTPENGEFVAVAFSVTTAANYLDVMTSGIPLRVSTSDWLGQQADGTVTPNTDTATSCVGDSSLPDEIAAGETATGVVFVDTAAATPGISFSPANVSGIDQQSVRWEWPVG